MHATSDHLRTQSGPERGIMLIEVVITLIVLSIGLLALAQLMPSASRRQLEDQMATRGTRFAQEKLEQLMAADWSSSALALGPHPATPEQIGPGGRWSRSWRVTQLTGSLSSLRKIEVNVSWTFQGAGGVQLVSYRGD